MPSFISTQERIAFVYAKQEKNLTLLLLDHRPFFSSGPAQGKTHLICATESNYIRTRRILEDGIAMEFRSGNRNRFVMVSWGNLMYLNVTDNQRENGKLVQS